MLSIDWLFSTTLVGSRIHGWKKLEYNLEIHLLLGCLHIWEYLSWNHLQLSKFYCYFSSYAMLFLDFLKICYLGLFSVPVVNTDDYVWFVIIKDFNQSRLEFIICNVISNIKIFWRFKLNTFLNIKATTTLSRWFFDVDVHLTYEIHDFHSI